MVFFIRLFPSWSCHTGLNGPGIRSGQRKRRGRSYCDAVLQTIVSTDPSTATARHRIAPCVSASTSCATSTPAAAIVATPAPAALQGAAFGENLAGRRCLDRESGLPFRKPLAPGPRRTEIDVDPAGARIEAEALKCGARARQSPTRRRGGRDTGWVSWISLEAEVGGGRHNLVSIWNEVGSRPTARSPLLLRGVVFVG